MHTADQQPTVCPYPTHQRKMRLKMTNIKISTITPEEAKNILASCNNKNRYIRVNKVSEMVRDLQNGDWRFNGDAIRFDSRGNLIDGQHRLKACHESGIPIKTLVVSGLDPSVMSTIDTGTKRSAGDLFSLKGVSYPTQVAASCRTSMMSKNPYMTTQTYTNDEVWDFYYNNKALGDFVSRLHNNRACPASILAPVAYASSLVSPHLTERFVSVWSEGYSEKGDPFMAVRNRIIDRALKRTPYNAPTKLKLVFWSLKKAMDGCRVSLVRVPDKVEIKGWNI